MTELFRDGDWALGRDEEANPNWTALPGRVWEYDPNGPEDVFVSHLVCGGLEYARFWLGTECPHCRKVVPDELLGLKSLVEWDRDIT